MIITQDKLEELVTTYHWLSKNTYLLKSVQLSHETIYLALAELKQHRAVNASK